MYLSQKEKGTTALLWRALEDGRIEESEGDSLVEIATHWGLNFDRVKAIHLDYLSQLAKAAWADRHITDAERREIKWQHSCSDSGACRTNNSTTSCAPSRANSVQRKHNAWRGVDWKNGVLHRRVQLSHPRTTHYA